MKNKAYLTLLAGLSRSLLALAVLLVLSQKARSQAVSTFPFAQTAGSYTAITGGTALSGSTWDNTIYTVTIPSFPFAGSYYTTMYVSTNGFLTFGSAPGSSEFNPLSSNDDYAGAISAFGADVENSSSGSPLIRWQQVGSEVIVQWTDARRQDVSSERISFQIRLNTTTGAINIVYGGTIAPQSSTSNYPQVGLRGASNSFPSNVNNRRVDTSSGAGSTWANTAAGQDNGSECRFNNTAGRAPVVGQTYTWTPPCLPPTSAAAGADQTICATPGSVTMAANTPTAGTGSWSQVGGTTATITTPGSPTTTITGLTSGGARTFRWTISTGASCTSSDDVIITVNATPSTSNAGSDQTVCAAPGSAAMNATAPTTGTGGWSFVSGPVTPTITTPSSRTSGITGMTTAGSYIFRWTVSNSPCTGSTDEVTISVTPTPTVANAGPDQSICITTAPSTTLAANVPSVGTGAWSIVSGPSTSVAQLSNITANNATFTYSGGAGSYTLRWTISNSPCTPSTNDVVVTVLPFAQPVSQTFNANGTFTVPMGVSQITVEAWGGGGAGGGSTNAGNLQIRGGAGGGGGAHVTKTLTVTPGSTLNITVGGAVVGTAGANGSSGNPSTITGFEAQVFAAGGTGGTANTTGNSPAGGAGGSLTASQGDTETAGANGGSGATGFIVGGNSGAGGAGANGGGTGGASVTSGSVAGNGGNAPGGGGSGARTQNNDGTRAGGQGAAGRLIITYTAMPSISATTTTICEGSNTTLTATGGGTYLWSPGGATSASIMVNPVATTNYSVQITNTCPIQLAQEITVIEPANAGSSNTLSLCSTDAPADMSTLLGPHEAGSWSGPSTVVNDQYDPATMVSGVYMYTVTGTAPCPNATASVNVTENTATFWYADVDGDSFGDPTSSQLACAAPANHVANSTDLCPSDVNKQAPGQCGCGNSDTDTDGDLTADCNDLCPIDPNKIAPGTCGCGVADVAETYYADTDGDGFGAGSPVSGFTCVVPGGHVSNNTDLCPTDANKQAPGQCGCGVPDTDTDGDLTADCNDLCPLDPNKIAPGQCGCGDPDTDSDSDSIADCLDACPLDANNDQDGDGLCSNMDTCPTVFGQNGDICDANPGPGYTLGQLTGCACVPVTCSTNLTLEFQTDANPNQITWQIMQQGTNTLVQSGGPMIAPNGIQTESTCLPNGCYYLKVLDGGGDGITNGGYILRTSGNPGIRIIDNRRNFNSGGVSQIAGNEGFCLPMSATQAIYTSCDKLDWTTGEYYVCSADPAVSAEYDGANAANSGYEFWIYNPNGGYSFRRFRSHSISDGFAPANATRACHMKINNWSAATHIPANVLMNMRIRTRIAGVNGAWGPACRMKIDPVRAACPLTKLMDIPGNQYYSCNTSRAFTTGQYVHARPVTGATQYQFRFRIDAEGFMVVRTVNTYFVQLNWTTLPLQNSKTYQVEVRAFKNGAWCIDTPNPAPGPNFTTWGDVCSLTIDNTPMGGGNENFTPENTSTGSAPQLMMYPNPNRGDQVRISLGAIAQDVNTVSVEIFDLTGKRAANRTIAVQDGSVNSMVELNGELTGGIYLVKVTAGNEQYTQRLAIEK